VVHRDIKPDNLFLLGPANDPFCVKIIDFGMAKIPQSNGSSGVNTVLGTVEYMAPEQVMADPVDARTDVYGLGILLFRLFTGQLPFESPEGMELLTFQLFSPVPRTSWICDDLCPWLEQVVARATCKHPDNRHQSMTELIAELDTALAPLRSEPEPLFLPVEPDVYEPRNPKGREVAGLLAERYQSIAPPGFGASEFPSAVSLVDIVTLDSNDLVPFADVEEGA
jgi:serine/threonine-protein kinase